MTTTRVTDKDLNRIVARINHVSKRELRALMFAYLQRIEDARRVKA